MGNRDTDAKNKTKTKVTKEGKQNKTKERDITELGEGRRRNSTSFKHFRPVEQEIKEKMAIKIENENTLKQKRYDKHEYQIYLC